MTVQGFRIEQNPAADLQGGGFDHPGVLEALLRREPLERVDLRRFSGLGCGVWGMGFGILRFGV